MAVERILFFSMLNLILQEKNMTTYFITLRWSIYLPVILLAFVFEGVGVWQRNGASGASHGGTGGQGACDNYLACKLRRSQAYGDLYLPKEHGSGGAGTKGGSGL